MKKVELLAPAGNMEKLKMALRYGADAVYLGGKSFGLRAYGGNFTNEELEEAIDLAHSMGKKVYVTVNIIPRNDEIDGITHYLKYLEAIHADAALISDPGVFSICREVAPNLPIHVSTQASTANWRAAQFWKDLGAERVVMAREVSLKEMAEIHKKVDVDLEVFVHGAMCISWSGRCLLSNFFTNGKRQSNQGECIQACRFRYSVMEESRPGQYWPIEEDGHGTYIMNSKDLCMIDHIPELIEAGAASLKIEGRMKSVYYAAAVTAAYRQAIDAYYAEGSHYKVRPAWRDELEKVSHRPYTTAFAFQKPDYTAQEYAKSQPEQPYDFIGLVLSYDGEKGEAVIQERNHFNAGETVECLSPEGNVYPVTIGALTNEDGDSVDAAVHPLEKVTMKINRKLLPYSILRRPRHG